jgi:peptidoglycan LD-endopeptidase CwlK
MTLSNSSSDKLSQCHSELQRLVKAVEERIGLVVSCGHRGKDEQDRAVAEGQSKTPWPTSKHNSLPSLAVDIEPLKRSQIDWNDKVFFYYFAGYVMAVADLIDVKVRWGGDWDSDRDLHDQSFFDLPHFELRER